MRFNVEAYNKVFPRVKAQPKVETNISTFKDTEVSESENTESSEPIETNNAESNIENSGGDTNAGAGESDSE